MRTEIQREGKPCIKEEVRCDFGAAGCARVTVYDPCVSGEARARRREAVKALCTELARKGRFRDGGELGRVL